MLSFRKCQSRCLLDDLLTGRKRTNRQDKSTHQLQSKNNDDYKYSWS